jgi:hypothetical protein
MSIIGKFKIQEMAFFPNKFIIVYQDMLTTLRKRHPSQFQTGGLVNVSFLMERSVQERGEDFYIVNYSNIYGHIYLK